MREFWHHFLTDRRWFLGTLIVLFIAFILFWIAVDQPGFVNKVNNLIQTICDLLKALFVIAVMFIGIRMMFGHRPWWMGGPKKPAGKH